jgi:DHA3 family tetracycline resistance protein-like MFS transporter
MFRKHPLNATTVFLFMEMADTLCLGLIFTASSLYEATTAALTPLELVLVGTTLEASLFLFEVPTGIVADVYSRRLSIIIGYLLMGVGFMVEGLFPSFLPILLAQLIFGLGYTFTSGAKQAWITDEVGEQSANNLFLRAARLALYATLAGLGLTALIGANNAAIPIRAGALGIFLIGISLAIIMPETGFHPTPQEARNTWQHMVYVFRQGLKAVRTRPRLVNLVFIALFYGVYSEGFDRLKVKLLLDHFNLPVWLGSNQVVFFAAIRAIGTVLSIFAIRFVERRVNTGKPSAIGRALLLVTGSITVAMLAFAISPILSLAVGAMIIVDLLRNVAEPLQSTWINQKLDPDTRATVYSMFGQVDAIGQIGGGPLIGLIGAVSVRLAMFISAMLLSPALWFIARANRQTAMDTRLAEPESAS